MIGDYCWFLKREDVTSIKGKKSVSNKYCCLLLVFFLNVLSRIRPIIHLLFYILIFCRSLPSSLYNFFAPYIFFTILFFPLFCIIGHTTLIVLPQLCHYLLFSTKCHERLCSSEQVRHNETLLILPRKALTLVASKISSRGHEQNICTFLVIRPIDWTEIQHKH